MKRILSIIGWTFVAYHVASILLIIAYFFLWYWLAGRLHEGWITEVEYDEMLPNVAFFLLAVVPIILAGLVLWRGWLGLLPGTRPPAAAPPVLPPD